MLMKTIAVTLAYPTSKQISKYVVSRMRHLGQKSKSKNKQQIKNKVTCGQSYVERTINI